MVGRGVGFGADLSEEVLRSAATVVAKRTGAALFLVGVGIVGLGLVSQWLAQYSLLNRSPGSSFTLSYEAYQHFSDVALFLQAIGVLLAAISWSWIQLARSGIAVGSGGPGRGRTVGGVVLAICGSLVFAVWALVIASATESHLSGGSVALPLWFTLGETLFAGIGLGLWAAGWFVIRWNAN